MKGVEGCYETSYTGDEVIEANGSKLLTFNLFG